MSGIFGTAVGAVQWSKLPFRGSYELLGSWFNIKIGVAALAIAGVVRHVKEQELPTTCLTNQNVSN